MKPIIGISVDCKQDEADARTGGQLTLNWNYAQAVAEAGGVPILIPPSADMEEVAKIIHGWVIPGGDDIDARHFGEENHPKVELQDPARFDAEARLYRVLDAETPVLGICYGCQFLNVVRGGSLIQHLPDVEGKDTHTGGVMQAYEIDPASKLEKIVGETAIEGKSYHHQAINTVGTGLTVVAKSEDGTVEALESTDRPWMIGLQWHPERTFADPKTRRIFEDFIAAARRNQESRGKVFA